MTSAKKLKEEVYELAQPEGRKVGTQGHDKARDLIVAKMINIGLVPYKNDSFEIPYHNRGIDFTNIIGVVKSNFPEKAPLLIGAHYDSVIEAPCADDNAAAVVLALATGKYFQTKNDEFERDIIIAIFDAEEPPFYSSQSMGSDWFYQTQMDTRGVHAAIIMDLVGHDVLLPEGSVPLGALGAAAAGMIVKDLFFITGAESAPEFPDFFKAIGTPKGLRVINALNSYVGDMSDHGVFRRNGIPYLFLSCGRWQHYHQETDTPDKLNYHKMEYILKYLLTLTAKMATTNLTPNINENRNTVELECNSFKNAFSPFTSMLLKLIGLDDVATRSDIDKIASFLMSKGL